MGGCSSGSSGRGGGETDGEGSDDESILLVFGVEGGAFVDCDGEFFLQAGNAFQGLFEVGGRGGDSGGLAFQNLELYLGVSKQSQECGLGTNQPSGFCVDAGQDSGGIVDVLGEFFSHDRDSGVKTVLHEYLKLRGEPDQAWGLGVGHGIHTSWRKVDET